MRTTLLVVVRFYEVARGFVFTPEEKTDVVAFHERTVRVTMSKKIMLALSLVALSACSQPLEGSPSVSVCDDVEPRRIAVNGQNLNGVQINGIQNNGVSLAGIVLADRPSVGRALRGVRTDGSTIELVVASEVDGLYELTHDGANVCANGERGVFVAGTWDARGARQDSALATFSCTSGAIAKCVLWGYDPARVGATMHQACTRMVRADYCGDGISSTRDGTKIDVFDTRGVQSAANEPGFAFEAGWNENGATCVNRARLAGAVPSCWRDLPTCNSAEDAMSRGASLMNASQPICH